MKFGLSLSGGGFRATLYHLGVVRFLRDAGVLQNVTDIASVSGGSILAAHLVLNWDRYNGDDESFSEAASDIVKLVQFDLRNHIVRRLPIQLPLRLISKFLFLERRNFTSNAILERYYTKHLYGERCLYELPEQPMLHILATSISTGALSVFNRQGLFIQERHGDGERPFKHVPGRLARISRIVGASSAFPGFFPPTEITAADLGVREGQFPTEFFTDGGVYDNLGLRAFSWLEKQQADFDQILVSDAGKPFQILSDPSLGFIGQSVRASDILWDRVGQLERENFRKQEGFLFLPITESVDLSVDSEALHPVVQVEVQTIRTDLDRFSVEEINALSQHGYEVARKLFRQHNVLGDANLPEAPPWAAIPDVGATKKRSILSHAHEPSATTRLSRQLHKSSHRRVVATFFDWRDWPSYVYLAIAFLFLGYLPFQVYELYRKSQTQAVIIEAIASGDPDIRHILDLATSDPTSEWTGEEIREKPAPAEVSFEGVEILTHNRIYDLRRWNPDEESADHRGQVYIRDRITLKLLRSYKGDGRIIFRAPFRAKNVEFRQPKESIRGIISRTSEPVETAELRRTLYEFEYDLSRIPLEEPVTIVLEAIADFPKTVRAPLVTHAKTDLISVWMLFPADRPYKAYSLVSYPIDGSLSPSIMDNRYAIDHPYGTFIGWSVLNPREDRVYECRWTTE